jgi:hypothetical protein
LRTFHGAVQKTVIGGAPDLVEVDIRGEIDPAPANIERRGQQ